MIRASGKPFGQIGASEFGQLTRFSNRNRIKPFLQTLRIHAPRKAQALVRQVRRFLDTSTTARAATMNNYLSD